MMILGRPGALLARGFPVDASGKSYYIMKNFILTMMNFGLKMMNRSAAARSEDA